MIIRPPMIVLVVRASFKKRAPQMGARILSRMTKSPTSALKINLEPFPMRSLDTGMMKNPIRKIG